MFCQECLETSDHDGMLIQYLLHLSAPTRMASGSRLPHSSDYLLMVVGRLPLVNAS
jgi:hypothetical protein